MKVGDILVFINIEDHKNESYTTNKHYMIYKIDDDFVPGCRCGYIKDDFGSNCYFREHEATDINWKYLKDIRREKLDKINLCSITE